MDIREFNQRFDHVSGPNKAGEYTMRCPCHDDKTASLTARVKPGTDGRLRIFLCCHAGCSNDSILAQVGLKPVDLIIDPEPPKAGGKWKGKAEKKKPAPAPKPTQDKGPEPPAEKAADKPKVDWAHPDAVYSYTDVNGKELFQVVRYPVYKDGNFHPKNLPASFGDTSRNIQKKAFLVKDMPLLVDDFHPVTSLQERKQMVATAQTLSRAFGDGADRGRLNADSTIKSSELPRSVAIITGEDLPAVGQSGLARFFIVDVDRGDIPVGKEMTDLQEAARNGYLQKAMLGYIKWLQQQTDGLPERLREMFLNFRQMCIDINGMEGRAPETVACILVGYAMMLDYFRNVGLFDADTAKGMLQDAHRLLTATSKQQARSMDDEKPTRIFLDSMVELMASNSVVINERIYHERAQVTKERDALQRDLEDAKRKPGTGISAEARAQIDGLKKQLDKEQSMNRADIDHLGGLLRQSEKRVDTLELEKAELTEKLADAEKMAEYQAQERQKAQQELLDLQTQAARGEGPAREDLTAEAVGMAARTFIGSVGYVPHSDKLLTMREGDREAIATYAAMLQKWAEDVLHTIRMADHTVVIEGV